MNREIIDKCLDFAEGKKGTFTILTVKKPDFPENLISGTEKQQTLRTQFTTVLRQLCCLEKLPAENIRWRL